MSGEHAKQNNNNKKLCLLLMSWPMGVGINTIIIIVNGYTYLYNNNNGGQEATKSGTWNVINFQRKVERGINIVQDEWGNGFRWNCIIVALSTYPWPPPPTTCYSRLM